MADSKQLRQFAAQQVPASTAMRGKRPEDLDEQGQDAEQAATEAQDAPAADSMSSEAPASEPLHTARVATDAAAGTEGGPSTALIGAGALGAVGLVVAVAGGGGGKSGDFKPPVIGTLDPDVPPPKPERPTPRPTPEEPKPEQPKPGDQKPQEPAPNPEGQTKPEQPTNPGGNPETPTNPSGPSPEEQKPDTGSPSVIRLPAPTVTLVNDTGNDDYYGATSDGITNDGTLSVGGISEGATWRYSIDGGEWKVGASDGRIPASDFMDVQGRRHVQVHQVSAAGVAGDIGEFEFELDTRGPGAIFPLFQEAPILTDEPDKTWVIDWDNFSKSEAGSAVYFSLDRGESWMRSFLHFFDVTGNDGSRVALVNSRDMAGNWGEATEFNFYLNTSAPSTALRVDSGISSSDAVTNDSTLVIGDLVAGASWKYSVDGGQTWKAGNAENEIAASEFGFDEGVKSVKVQQFTTDGSKPFPNSSESAIRTYEFTFQRQAVEVNIGIGDNFAFQTNGTVGADRFVVNTVQSGRSFFGDYRADQGDVIDLRGLFDIESGKQISDYIGITTGVGGRAVNVSYDGQLAENSDMRLVFGNGYFGDISVMYSGGVLVG